MYVKLTSANTGQFLAEASASGILIYELKQLSELESSFAFRMADQRKMNELINRTGDRIDVIRTKGFLQRIRGIMIRPVMLVTILLCTFLSLFLPTRILFVTVEGNSTVSQESILTAAADCGICFGAKRREIRSEKCKNNLLSAIPQLQWVGINTYGCVATVSVRERTKQDYIVMTEGITGLRATTDGIIRELVVTSGNPVCTVGDAVKKGQLLVSAYTDYEQFIRLSCAEGEIYADTSREINAVTPINYNCRTKKGREKKKYSIRIGKKVINLFKDSGILDTTCVKMINKYSLAVGDDLKLPLSIIEYTYVSYETAIMERTAEQLEWLPLFCQNQIQEAMNTGQINRSRSSARYDTELCYYNGQYDCYEMIAEPFQEEIAINNGKRD